MRSEKVLKNGFGGFVYRIVNLIMGFVGRTMFIRFLNADYLGINGLFTNILSLLSLSELGFSAAIIFHLYKPLAEKDEDTISGIVNFYKKAYRIIAGAIFVMGIALVPFLQYLIKESTFDIGYIRIVYVIYLIKTVLSYFYAYTFTVARADQKEYMLINIDSVFRFIITGANILTLVLFRNYIVFLTVEIAISLLGSVIKARRVYKNYPYIKSKKMIAPEMRKKIMTDVKNVFASKVSTVIVNSTDNILISSMISITATGLYSNYSMLIAYIKGFVDEFVSATQASIGNMFAMESKEYSYKIMKRLTMIIYFVVSSLSVCLFCLLNPFIEIWLGKKYLLSLYVVGVCILSFYLQLLKIPLWFSMSGAGFFKQDRNVAIVGAVSNLVISVIAAKLWGLVGIFIGTVISQSIQWVMKLYVMMRDYYKQSGLEYLMMFLKLLALTTGMCAAVWFINGFINFESEYISFFAKAGVCVVLPVAVNFLLYRKSEDFDYIKVLVLRIAGKIFKKVSKSKTS